MKQSLLKILKVLGWTIVGVLLLFVGAMQVLYTEWFQNDLRVSLVNRVNADQNKKMTLDKLEINFPLELINKVTEGTKVKYKNGSYEIPYCVTGAIKLTGSKHGT